ncbi:hypothetical protein HDU97_007443 [Phlyctochytrium planicorne]|nr:hypothetical protein HDU97_007443 [Phlyctochytrium planicorne]
MYTLNLTGIILGDAHPFVIEVDPTASVLSLLIRVASVAGCDPVHLVFSRIDDSFLIAGDTRIQPLDDPLNQADQQRKSVDPELLRQLMDVSTTVKMKASTTDEDSARISDYFPVNFFGREDLVPGPKELAPHNRFKGCRVHFFAIVNDQCGDVSSSIMPPAYEEFEQQEIWQRRRSVIPAGFHLSNSFENAPPMPRKAGASHQRQVSQDMSDISSRLSSTTTLVDRLSHLGISTSPTSPTSPSDSRRSSDAMSDRKLGFPRSVPTSTESPVPTYAPGLQQIVPNLSAGKALGRPLPGNDAGGSRSSSPLMTPGSQDPRELPALSYAGISGGPSGKQFGGRLFGGSSSSLEDRSASPLLTASSHGDGAMPAMTYHGLDVTSVAALPPRVSSSNPNSGRRVDLATPPASPSPVMLGIGVEEYNGGNGSPPMTVTGSSRSTSLSASRHAAMAVNTSNLTSTVTVSSSLMLQQQGYITSNIQNVAAPAHGSYVILNPAQPQHTPAMYSQFPSMAISSSSPGHIMSSTPPTPPMAVFHSLPVALPPSPQLQQPPQLSQQQHQLQTHHQNIYDTPQYISPLTQLRSNSPPRSPHLGTQEPQQQNQQPQQPYSQPSMQVDPQKNRVLESSSMDAALFGGSPVPTKSILKNRAQPQQQPHQDIFATNLALGGLKDRSTASPTTTQYIPAQRGRDPNNARRMGTQQQERGRSAPRSKSVDRATFQRQQQQHQQDMMMSYGNGRSPSPVYEIIPNHNPSYHSLDSPTTPTTPVWVGDASSTSAFYVKSSGYGQPVQQQQARKSVDGENAGVLMHHQSFAATALGGAGGWQQQQQLRQNLLKLIDSNLFGFIVPVELDGSLKHFYQFMGEEDVDGLASVFGDFEVRDFGAHQVDDRILLVVGLACKKRIVEDSEGASDMWLLLPVCHPRIHILHHTPSAALESTSHPKKHHQACLIPKKILLIVPLYAICAFLNYSYPNVRKYAMLIHDTYEGFAVYSFFSLCLLYLGHTWESQLEAIERATPRRYPPPMCCFRYNPAQRDFLPLCKVGILQLFFSRIATGTVMFVVNAMAWECAHCSKLQTPTFWVFIVNSVAMGLSMFTLVTFYLAVHKNLPEGRPVYQFLSIKFVLFVPYIQNILLEFLIDSGTLTSIADIPIEELQVALTSTLISIEMVLAAILHVIAFPVSEFQVADENIVKVPVYKAFLDAVQPDDLWNDTRNSFLFFGKWLVGIRGEYHPLEERSSGDVEVDGEAEVVGEQQTLLPTSPRHVMATSPSA